MLFIDIDKKKELSGGHIQILLFKDIETLELSGGHIEVCY